MNDAEYRAVLAKHGMAQPFPERTITEARWVAAHGDWWVRIDSDWYWWDRREAVWKPSQHGPS